MSIPMSQGFDNGNVNPYAPPEARDFDIDSPNAFEPQLLASRGSRLGARLIDGLLQYAAAFLIGTGVRLALGLPRRSLNEAGVDTYVLGAFAWLVPLSVQWYLTATTGQSIGKRLLGLKIVKMDGSPVDFVSGVILREWIGRLIDSVTCGIGTLMIFGDQQRCLHDHVASTKVILAGSSD
ncbi:RDD family protein [Polyangium aurulentum]|uniref:RDD family protein n=1 Tax=Polyangium aurulentum TaxID=2567896 RepID=UPI0010AE362E|nr:RDD family protein [Polyangium aurulentum]UQA59579.1 RDD family protein [Polyangium aurulentum]